MSSEMNPFSCDKYFEYPIEWLKTRLAPDFHLRYQDRRMESVDGESEPKRVVHMF
jgi:hypothetical protein